MPKKKKPKFKIGDIVVITLYGTVGTITNIHILQNEYLYEVNHSEILYFENTLVFLSDYEGNVYESEMIEIEYIFGIGDLVQVSGYDQDMFKVVGIHTELWRYKEDAWEEVTYELVRVSDGQWIEASEDELKIVMSQSEAEKLIQNIQLIHLISELTNGSNQQTLYLPLPEEKKESKTLSYNQNQLIDSLLDIYNDYKFLYDWFQDEEYKDIMNFILNHLKKYTD